MTRNISISVKEHFQTTLNNLTTLNNDLTAKLDTTPITTAITAAATSSPASGGTGKVANAYTDTITALDTATKNIADQARTASTAVSTAITDLQSLLTGLTNIDDSAAGQVNKIG